MNELKIPICINSDSHRPEEITASFDTAFTFVEHAGYRERCLMLNNQWQHIFV
jgi:histidinol-phosphatase (PHP family)